MFESVYGFQFKDYLEFEILDIIYRTNSRFSLGKTQ